MWTSTLDLDLKRLLLTRLLGPFWSGAYFSSFAPLRVQNLPRQPLAAPNWVRVRNRLAGICGSDLHLIMADADLRTAPAALPRPSQIFLGHEVVGEVIEIGDEVTNLQIGDRVALQYGPNCLSAGVPTPCRPCSLGNYNLCEYGALPGPLQSGGGWSEEMLLHEQQLFRVPAALSDEQAVLLEPSAVALHSVLRHIPAPGERVLVIGAGTIGLLTLQVIRALAPQAEISVLARHSFQVEQATRMGAAHIIYPQDSYLGVQRVTHSQIQRGLPGNQTLLGGYDVIFDTVGRRKTLHHALRWARTGATIVLVGIDLHLMHIDLSPIWHQELNLLGVHSSGIETWPPDSQEQQTSFAIAAEMIEQGYLHPEYLITHHYALTNYQHALQAAAGKTQSRAIKVVFDYSLLPASVVPNVRASAPRRRRSALLSEEEEARQLAESDEEEAQAETQDTEHAPYHPVEAVQFEPQPLIISPPPARPALATSQQEDIAERQTTDMPLASTPARRTAEQSGPLPALPMRHMDEQELAATPGSTRSEPGTFNKEKLQLPVWTQSAPPAAPPVSQAEELPEDDEVRPWVPSPTPYASQELAAQEDEADSSPPEDDLPAANTSSTTFHAQERSRNDATRLQTRNRPKKNGRR